MKSLLDTEVGIFYPLSKGHMVTRERVPAGLFCLGTQIAAATMFQIFELKRDDTAVGFFLYSGFKVVNKGGVLLTYLESKKGKATASSVVFRDPLLVVYDIAGCGSIAVSTTVNDRISSILSEQ
jgi:hypothetical protein